PDAVVVDVETGHDIDKRYVDRFYLAAEVVSSSDRTYVESKREVYKLHEACRYVLTIQQQRIEVRVNCRTDKDWNEEILMKPGDVLALPDFGLNCKIADLYRGTPLQRR